MCVGKHGEVIWLEDHFLSYKGTQDGRLADKLLAYTVNVTSQCEKEQHINHLEEHNRKIIEALPEFIFIFDDNFFKTEIFLNEAAFFCIHLFSSILDRIQQKNSIFVL